MYIYVSLLFIYIYTPSSFDIFTCKINILFLFLQDPAELWGADQHTQARGNWR